MKVALLSLALVASAVAQNIGTQKQNVILPLSYETCTGSEQCTQQSGGITLDSNWRWTHRTDSATNCYTGNAWDTSICSTPAACTSACAIDGVDNADWTGTYGVTASGSELSLKFVTQGPFSKNIGSRTYLTEAGGSRYRMFHLLNQEFTFDVDVSDLACGLNGALYFVEMEADGGMASHPTNKAGAAYGTGYCDAQCPHDVKWINGEANSQDWVPSATDPNSGKGHYGTCCQEMDIWEANSISQAYTTHPCATVGQERCEGVACGDNSSGDRYNGVCDKDGCDFASYRNFDHEFYGPGKTVDTNQKMTVVTQFITTDGTADGDLQEIRRLYVQNGVVFQNSKVEFDDASVAGLDSITEGFCDNIKTYFEDFNHHQQLGGLKEMGESLRRGHVLVLSLWADHEAHMLWLDSDYPVDADPTKPGVSRGTCDTSSGVPAEVESQYPDATVRFSKIRVGDIGSTYPATK